MRGRLASSRAAWLAVGAALVTLLWHGWYGPDIWCHLFLGREVLETHSASPPDHLFLKQPAYLNIYWLFQIVIYGLYRLAGTVGVSLFFVAAWLGIFVLWGRTARVFELPLVGLPLALLSVIACQTRFEERPEVVSWLILALFIRVLSKWRLEEARRSIVVLGIAQVLWTNVHGYFFLGPVLALLRLVTLLVAIPRSRRELKSISLLLLVLLGCSLVSPFGLRAWTGVFQLGRLLKDLRFAIEELKPPLGSYLELWAVWVFWLCWTITALAAVAVLLRKREVFACLLAAIGLVLSATSLRNMPAVVIFSGPLWAAVLPATGRIARRHEARVAVVVLSLSLALCAWTIEGGFHRSLAARVRFGIEPYGHAFPAQFASSYLQRTGFRGSVFNHPSDGGYLELHVPELRLYGDPRFTEPGPVREYLDALFDPRSFLALDARHHFDAVLINLAGGQDALLQLLERPEWKLAYADLNRALLVNGKTPAGSTASLTPPSFYSGEDLSQRLDGYCAIRWAYALAQLDRTDLLVVLLRQLSAAKQVPSPVVALALEHARRRHDGAILEAARALHPRILALTPEDAAAVERLMQ